MTIATRICTNQVVHVSGRHGSVFARVLRAQDAATLPELPKPAPEAQRVREILAEGGVEQVAMIAWLIGAELFCCVVMGDGTGHWKDLHRADVYIRALTPAEMVEALRRVPPTFEQKDKWK